MGSAVTAGLRLARTAASSRGSTADWPDIGGPINRLYATTVLQAGEIRLLYLNEAEDVDEQIIFDICVEKFSEAVYVAVSYCWGTEPRDHVVFWKSRAIPVTRSCRDSLVACRNEGFGVVWIDQLSIDQSNLAERSQQVQSMGAIYAHAISVHVWLGWFKANRNHAKPENPSIMSSNRDIGVARYSSLLDFKIHASLSDVAVEQRCAKGVLLLHLLVRLHSRTDYDNEDFTGIVDLLSDEDAWHSLIDIYNRPYFRRRWIIQESVMNGGQILAFIDGFEFDFDALYEVILSLDIDRQFPENHVSRSIPRHLLDNFYNTLVLEIRTLRAIDTVSKGVDLNPRADSFRSKAVAMTSKAIETQSEVTQTKLTFMESRARTLEVYAARGRRRGKVLLSNILDATQNSQYLDPRDCFYAIRSLWHDARKLPKPDYELAPYTVYIQHAQYLIDIGEGPELIQSAGLLNGPQRTSVPSWCSAWAPENPSDTEKPRPFLPLLEEHNSSSKAPDRLNRVSVTTTPSIRVEGDNHATLHVNGATVARVVALASCVCYRPEENRIERVKSNKSFVRQHGRLEDHQTYWTTQSPKGHDLLSSYIFSHTWPDDQSGSSDSDDEDENDLIQQGYLTERKLCATQQSWIGLVPTIVEIDDKIIVFEGFTVPMVIRPSPTKPGCFNLVGDAYFWQLAYGQALKMEAWEPRPIALV